MLGTMLKMILSLAVVLAVFGAAVFAFKKLSGSSKSFLTKGKGLTGKPLEVLAFQSLGPGRSVYLVRCLDRKILVGATNASITRLAEMGTDEDNQEDAFSNLLDGENPARAETGFKANLSNSLREISRV